MEKRVIIPLDGMTKGEALNMSELLAPYAWGFKVNDLLVDCGVDIITRLKGYGKVMADLKLYDIPNTVANSAKKIKEAGADLITVHASGGFAMMEKAVSVAPSNILAVTVLTSFDEENCQLVYGATIKAKVLQFAREAQAAGCYGIVCSGQELEFLAGQSGVDKLALVNPGIRPAWYVKEDDQKRVVTPAKAIKMGATLLVIGRPITKAEDPIEAIKKTNEEIAVTLAE